MVGNAPKLQAPIGQGRTECSCVEPIGLAPMTRAISGGVTTRESPQITTRIMLELAHSFETVRKWPNTAGPKGVWGAGRGERGCRSDPAAEAVAAGVARFRPGSGPGPGACDNNAQFPIGKREQTLIRRL